MAALGRTPFKASLETARLKELALFVKDDMLYTVLWVFAAFLKSSPPVAVIEKYGCEPIGINEIPVGRMLQ